MQIFFSFQFPWSEKRTSNPTRKIYFHRTFQQNQFCQRTLSADGKPACFAREKAVSAASCRPASLRTVRTSLPGGCSINCAKRGSKTVMLIMDVHFIVVPRRETLHISITYVLQRCFQRRNGGFFVGLPNYGCNPEQWSPYSRQSPGWDPRVLQRM